MDNVRAALTGRGEPVIIRGAQVSAGFFRIMRVQPERGRPFTADEDREGAPHVIVLSHAVWQERFDADPRIVGRTITMNGNAYTVTGIMPARLRLPAPDHEQARPSSGCRLPSTRPAPSAAAISCR